MLPEFPTVIADESVDARIIRSLVGNGYNVFSIREKQPGLSDSSVIKIALEMKGFIITEDKDFGNEIVYKKTLATGTLLLRISDIPIESRLHLVLYTLSEQAGNLLGSFSVLTSKRLRIRKI